MSAGICRCGECHVWERNPDKPKVGRCMYAPPRAELVPVQGIGGQGLSVVAIYPETRETDGCGFGDKTILQPASLVPN